MTVAYRNISVHPLYFYFYVWEREIRTVGRPIASGDDTVHALLGADLLAKRGDARICHESRVESVHAVPGRISRMGAARARACVHQRARRKEEGPERTFVRNIRPKGIAERERT